MPPNPSAHPLRIGSQSRCRRSDLLRYLEQGGFPGIFSVRDTEARNALLEDWLQLVTSRDLMAFSHLKPDAELAYDLLRQIAILPETNVSQLSRILGYGARKVMLHLKLLEQLFVIHSVRPHPSGSGKARYYLCDAGLAHYLGASFQRTLETWFWLELLSQRSYRGDVQTRYFYYRSARGGILDVVAESPGRKFHVLKLVADEGYDSRDFEILRAFEKKTRDSGALISGLYVLSPVSEGQKEGKIQILPWERVI